MKAADVTPTQASLPAGLLPRGLTKTQAAAYVGCATVRSFEAQIERGIFPGTMPGTRVWDRRALDAVMDRLSGLGGPAAKNDADALLAAWEAKQRAGQRRNFSSSRPQSSTGSSRSMMTRRRIPRAQIR